MDEALRIASEGQPEENDDFNALSWINRNYLFNLLNEKPELLEDATLSSLKTSLDDGPIASFKTIDDSIIATEDSLGQFAGDTLYQDGIDSLKAIIFDNLDTQNSAIIPERNSEENLQAVNTIYLSTIARGDLALTVQQRSDLEYLASLCSYHDGNAVYTAQNILNLVDGEIIDYSHNCDGVTMRKGKNIEAVINDNYSITPNPATNFIEVKYFVNTSNTFIIRDIANRIVKQHILNDKQNSITINVSDIPSGVYFSEINSNYSTVFKQKLIIIK